MIKSTNYCDILKEASIENLDKDCKMAIEEIYINDLQRKEVRFTYYKLNENGNYKLVIRPLDVTEDELFELFQKSIKNNVISNSFAIKIRQTIENTKVGNCLDQPFNDTDYCRFYARGSFLSGDFMCTLEQIFIKELDRREIRFGYYKKNKNGNFQLVTRPLDVTEDEFIVMFKDAIENGVFSKIFITALKTIL
ncbi:hypothetical protein J2Z44_004182 [Clostridium punense]|uniref:Uncharacterized protein n=1 Tax=Clostridium punense TaxID=1054297 RepID=A0ABS4K972_9CLOT|nr:MULTISPECIES: hypothetical protein [Clostridium]EQB88755.1 hypothetical protein M918_23350 [Clostridium sp. BL8]MBP2024322.1 hypothetical protein [Clostridium punense]